MQPSPKKSSAIITGLFFTIALFMICMWLPEYLSGLSTISITKSNVIFLSRVLQWFWLGAVWWYVANREKQPLLLWADKPRTAVFYILSTLGILVSALIGGVVISQLILHPGLHKPSKTIEILANLNIPLKLLTVCTAALVEELVFRGYLLPRLQLYFKGAAWPIIISALIFGAVHFSYGTIENIAVPTFIGIVFAWYYQKYRNIKVLILCHFLIDFYALFGQG